MERAGGGPPPFTWYRNLMELGAPVEIFVGSTMWRCWTSTPFLTFTTLQPTWLGSIFSQPSTSSRGTIKSRCSRMTSPSASPSLSACPLVCVAQRCLHTTAHDGPGLPFIFVYLNQFLVASPDHASHKQHLCEVLCCLCRTLCLYRHLIWVLEEEHILAAGQWIQSHCMLSQGNIIFTYYSLQYKLHKLSLQFSVKRNRKIQGCQKASTGCSC